MRSPGLSAPIARARCPLFSSRTNKHLTMAFISLYETPNQVEVRAAPKILESLFSERDELWIPDHRRRSHANSQPTNKHAVIVLGPVHATLGMTFRHDAANPQHVLDTLAAKHELISTHYNRQTDSTVYLFKVKSSVVV